MLSKICFAASLFPFVLLAGAWGQKPPAIELKIDASAKGTAFPHYWEQMFGSGRAILSLREGYRKDLRTVKQATGFTYVRFHAIFHDEAGFFDLDANGKPIYNFSYVDQIYDGLLENGVKPFVELSFMPQKMASDPKMLHTFWYKQNISPPKDYAMWDAMIEAFTRHLVERYGIDEVSQWYFEVWNEPNIDFWGGDPKLEAYLKLYDHTARDVKRVDGRLRVGGPATARVEWTPEFLAYCKQHDVPVDFLSTHVYGNDSSQDVFGTKEVIPQDRMVFRAVSKVHEQIKASPYPQMPLIMSEYNATYLTQPEVTDSTFMGPWLANTIRQCDGLTAMMSYWSFSDVFEEQGVVKTPFYGGYGLIAENNIPKPALNAFAMLHELGETRLHVDSDSALVTRRKDGAIVAALWNYAPPSAEPVTGASKSFVLKLAGAGKHARITRLDATHGNVNPAFAAMGKPANPSQAQIIALREAGKPAAAEVRTLEKNGELKIDVPSQGLVVVEIVP
ncbi:MAG TPA: glycosyl hydrolase family 39 [Acidobacteriaceae bacterium]